jgi:hypothetical protein
MHPAVEANPALLGLAEEALRDGLAAGTRRAYSSGWKKFLKFCAAHSTPDRFINPMPASEATIALFVVHESVFIGYSAIKVALCAVRSAHIEAGFESPIANALMLERVVRSIKRSCDWRPREVRRPLTTGLLKMIKPLLDLDGCHDDRCIWAGATIGVFCLMRAGEFLAPSSKKVVLPLECLSWATVGRSHGIIHLRTSKTDIFRRGVNLHFFRNMTTICPVEEFESYLAGATFTLSSSK